MGLIVGIVALGLSGGVWLIFGLQLWSGIAMAIIWFALGAYVLFAGHWGFGGGGNTDLNLYVVVLAIALAVVIPRVRGRWDSEACTIANESLNAVVAAELAYSTTHGRYTFEIPELDLTLPDRVIAIANAGTNEELAITVSNPRCDENGDGEPDLFKETLPSIPPGNVNSSAKETINSGR